MYSEDDEWMSDVWALPNRAVAMSYFCVGFATRFLTTPIAYFAVRVLGERPRAGNMNYPVDVE